MELRKNVNRFLMVLFALIYSIPLYVAFINAFKNYNDIVKSPLLFPARFTLDNLAQAFTSSHFEKLYFNSIVITVVSVSLLVLVSSMAAYVLARRKGAWVSSLYLFILAGLMVPQQVVLIPSMKTLQFFNLLHTFPGIIFFYVATYMSIAFFLFAEFFKTLPLEIEESATIDGAGQFRVFFQILFPLLKPCTATVVIFLGVWVWNDFLPPLYILDSLRGSTITTGIYRSIGQYTTAWNLVFAAVIFASAPVILLYLALQKQFRSGLAAGAIKG